MPDLSTKTIPSGRRWWRVLGIGFAGLVLLLVFTGLIENWRGQHAWERFRSEWQAKGAPFELAAVIPAPVPSEENFAATPLLAPLLGYYRVAGQSVQWNDPKGNEHARQFGDVFKSVGKKKAPPFGIWQAAQFTDLQP